MAWTPKRLVKWWLRRMADGMGMQEMTDELKRLREICISIQHQTAVAPDGLPIPPPELHFLVSGNAELDPSAFFDIGRACADSVVGILKKHGVDIDDLDAILDFGCGCGRVIRHLRSLKRASLCGTDYNPKLIDWCKRHLAFAEFEVNGLSPPLAYGDNSFGLIYAFSVFTHLPEALQVLWLAELSRVLKPGGYLFLTTQGTAYANAQLSPREKEQFRSGQLVVVNAGASGKNICNAYHPPGYLQQNLAKVFELLEFVPGDVVGPGLGMITQDSYLLKKS